MIIYAPTEIYLIRLIITCYNFNHEYRKVFNVLSHSLQFQNGMVEMRIEKTVDTTIRVCY